MKSRAIDTNHKDLPPGLRSFVVERQNYVTTGKEYDVHCISVFGGIVFLQIVNDAGIPSWCPADIFEIVEKDIPSDWKCGVFPYSAGAGLTMLLGPEFIVRDEEAYNAMVELQADQVDLFWKWIEGR